MGFPKVFGRIFGGIFRETQIDREQEAIRSKNGASRSMSNQVYLRVVLRAKTRPRRLQDALRLPKMPQDAPRHPPDAPKTPQVAPRCRQEAPKRRPGGQLGSKNQEKSIKKRCQNIIPSRIHFLIDFWTIFAYNFVPRILKNRALAAGIARFL